MQRFLFSLVLLCCLNVNFLWAQPEREWPDDEQMDTTSVQEFSTDPIKDQKAPFTAENFFIGMTFSLFFGNEIYVEGSPYVGYLLGDYIGVGLGGTYIYNAVFNGTRYISDNVYGGRVFINLRPLPQVGTLRGAYLRVEGEYLNHSEFLGGRVIRRFVPAVNLGIGFNTSFDNGFGITTEFLVNALWFDQVANNQTPVYNSPWQYRLGIYYAF